MNVWDYLRDHVRIIAVFLMSVVLTLIVIILDEKDHGFVVPFGDIVYAGALGGLCFTVYLVVEYLLRRSLYVEIRRRLDTTNVEATSEIFIRGTREQRAWETLLSHYHQMYLRDLKSVDDKRQFYELFLTRFAHQMKTPLTVIRLLGDELQRLPVEDAHAAKKMELMRSLAEERDRLDENLNLILQTARLTSFAVDAHMERFDLLALLRSAVNAHKAAWIRTSLYPKIVCQETSMWVRSDRKWLLFVCDQFLRNALQYGRRPNASGPSPFTIQVSQTDDGVTVSFVDEGIGIPSRDVRHVFDPFFTGSNGRTHSRATGMGLYLVKEVCERLGHRVSVTSQEGVGTTFVLELDESQYYRPFMPD